MDVSSGSLPGRRHRIRQALGRFWAPYRSVPMLGWLLAALVAVLMERFLGLPLARLLGMAKIPALFGIVFILDAPILFPIALAYMLLIYFIPIGLVARLRAGGGRRRTAGGHPLLPNPRRLPGHHLAGWLPIPRWSRPSCIC